MIDVEEYLWPSHPTTLSRHLGRTAPGAAERSISGQRSCPSPPCQRAATASTATLVARVRSLRGHGAGLKDIASRLPKGQEGLGSAISQASADWEDWYCGNGPRPVPHVTEIAGELLAFAGAGSQCSSNQHRARSWNPPRKIARRGSKRANTSYIHCELNHCNSDFLCLCGGSTPLISWGRAALFACVCALDRTGT